jgi:hypothetical protein
MSGALFFELVLRLKGCPSSSDRVTGICFARRQGDRPQRIGAGVEGEGSVGVGPQAVATPRESVARFGGISEVRIGCRRGEIERYPDEVPLRFAAPFDGLPPRKAVHCTVLSWVDPLNGKSVDGWMSVDIFCPHDENGDSSAASEFLSYARSMAFGGGGYLH